MDGIVNRIAATVLLLGLLGVAGCGDDPVPDSGSRVDERTAPSPAAPEEKATLRKRALRNSPMVTLRAEPREAWPATGMTGLAVTLTGTVGEHPSRWALFVCGLPVFFDEDGRFSEIRSFPKSGTYVVSAALRRPDEWRRVQDTDAAEEHATDCRITVSTTPEETAHVRALCADVISADGEVDEAKLHELIRTRDLRTVPTLRRVIEAHPNRESGARRRAVWALGSLAHLDSVPRLIRLLTDWGVHEQAYSQMSILGLWGPDLAQWRPPPSSEHDVRTVKSSLTLVFEEMEPALRKALHQ